MSLNIKETKMEDDPRKIIEFRKKKKPAEWKIQYQVQRKKNFRKDKMIFWIKFLVYLGLVSYVLQQCGIVSY